jgi:hypothetical protein
MATQADTMSRGHARAGTWMVGLVLAVLALSGCGFDGGPTTIDGFTLGAVSHCSPPVDADAATLDATCAGFPKRAVAALDAREPGHAAIIATTMYTDGTQPAAIDVTGSATLPPHATRHPGPDVYVFVFKLADGATKATGVACSGASAHCVGVGAYPS